MRSTGVDYRPTAAEVTRVTIHCNTNELSRAEYAIVHVAIREPSSLFTGEGYKASIST